MAIQQMIKSGFSFSAQLSAFALDIFNRLPTIEKSLLRKIISSPERIMLKP